MHSVNLDLLYATDAYQANGRPNDPHAHHAADCRALNRASRRAVWRARLSRLRHVLALRTAPRRAERQP